MVFRLYWRHLGGHVHCRLFAGPQEGALGKCGDLVFREDEFELFKQSSSFIQFRREET